MPARYPRRVNHAAWLGLPLLLPLCLGCTPSPPPQWAEGGAPLVIAAARWDRPDDDPIEIQADGRVLEGGDLRFVIDRIGRVKDDDGDAFAVLLPDGHLVGTDERALGYVGLNNATPPFADLAWLSLQPDGSVIFYEASGEPSRQGKWSGCAGPARRACTLVTQILVVRNFRAVQNNAVTFGVGMGVGIGF